MSYHTPEEWQRKRRVHKREEAAPSLLEQALNDVDKPDPVGTEQATLASLNKPDRPTPPNMPIPPWVAPIALLVLFGFLLKYYK
jgi:hypothetical protein